MSNGLTNSRPVRLFKKDEDDAAKIADMNGLTIDAVIRLAVRSGIPLVSEQLAPAKKERKEKSN